MLGCIQCFTALHAYISYVDHSLFQPGTHGYHYLINVLLFQMIYTQQNNTSLNPYITKYSGMYNHNNYSTQYSDTHATYGNNASNTLWPVNNG